MVHKITNYEYLHVHDRGTRYLTFREPRGLGNRASKGFRVVGFRQQIIARPFSKVVKIDKDIIQII